VLRFHLDLDLIYQLIDLAWCDHRDVGPPGISGTGGGCKSKASFNRPGFEGAMGETCEVAVATADRIDFSK